MKLWAWWRSRIPRMWSLVHTPSRCPHWISPGGLRMRWQSWRAAALQLSVHRFLWQYSSFCSSPNSPAPCLIRWSENLVLQYAVQKCMGPLLGKNHLSHCRLTRRKSPRRTARRMRRRLPRRRLHSTAATLALPAVLLVLMLPLPKEIRPVQPVQNLARRWWFAQDWSTIYGYIIVWFNMIQQYLGVVRGSLDLMETPSVTHGKIPFGLLHHKSPPQVPKIQHFPHILWRSLGLAGGFSWGPTQVEK